MGNRIRRREGDKFSKGGWGRRAGLGRKTEKRLSLAICMAVGQRREKPGFIPRPSQVSETELPLWLFSPLCPDPEGLSFLPPVGRGACPHFGGADRKEASLPAGNKCFTLAFARQADTTLMAMSDNIATFFGMRF